MVSAARRALVRAALVRRALVALVLALPAGAACRGERSAAPDAARLEAQGAEIRTALEAHYAQHVRYPATLADAGLDSAATATPHGPWRYAADSLGQRYRLSLGDRGRDGFALAWDGERQAWAWTR